MNKLPRLSYNRVSYTETHRYTYCSQNDRKGICIFDTSDSLDTITGDPDEIDEEMEVDLELSIYDTHTVGEKKYRETIRWPLLKLWKHY